MQAHVYSNLHLPLSRSFFCAAILFMVLVTSSLNTNKTLQLPCFQTVRRENTSCKGPCPSPS